MAEKCAGLAEDMLGKRAGPEKFYMEFLKPANYAPESANHSRSLVLPCIAD